MIGIYIFTTLVAVYVTAAAVTDLRWRKIPNVLTVPAALAGLAFHSLAPQGWGAWSSLAGFALGFVLLLAPWLLGGGGAGDIKLLAALGAWLGPKWMLFTFGLSIGCAALMAIVVLTVNCARLGMTRTRAKYMSAPTARSSRRARLLPFAVPVALATWCVLTWIITRGAMAS